MLQWLVLIGYILVAACVFIKPTQFAGPAFSFLSLITDLYGVCIHLQIFSICDWWNEPWSRDKRRKTDVFIEADKRWIERGRQRKQETDELSGVLEWRSISHLQTHGFWIICFSASDEVKRFTFSSDICRHVVAFTCSTLGLLMDVQQLPHTNVQFVQSLQSHVHQCLELKCQSKHVSYISVIQRVACSYKPGNHKRQIAGIHTPLNSYIQFSLDSKCSEIKVEAKYRGERKTF